MLQKIEQYYRAVIDRVISFDSILLPLVPERPYEPFELAGEIFARANLRFDFNTCFSPMYLAHYVLAKYPMTHKRLHKILYYIEAWHLVHFGHPIMNVNPQAYTRGPIYDDLWKFFKDKDDPLTAMEYDYAIHDRQKELIGEVIDLYERYDDSALSLLIHREKPYNEARKGLGILDPESRPISHEVMKEYYGARAL